MNRSRNPFWRWFAALAATIAMSGCAKDGGPVAPPVASAPTPWPASPEALIEEYAYAILVRSQEHYTELHAPGVEMERPDASGLCPPWHPALICLPWLADGYWQGAAGSERPCSDVDFVLDTEILDEKAEGDSRILLIRITIGYLYDPDLPPGLSEARLRFELSPTRKVGASTASST